MMSSKLKAVGLFKSHNATFPAPKHDVRFRADADVYPAGVRNEMRRSPDRDHLRSSLTSAVLFKSSHLNMGGVKTYFGVRNEHIVAISALCMFPVSDEKATSTLLTLSCHLEPL